MSVRNFTTLAWHSKLEEQAHRRSYAYGCVYPLVCGVNKVPPFQIVREHSVLTQWRAYLVADDGSEKDITQPLEVVGAAFDIGTDYDVLVYNGSELLLAGAVPEGQYYLHVTDEEGNEWFSDIFAATADIDNYMLIEWWDGHNFDFDGGRIVYDNFKNKLYVKSELGKPEYTYEEEGEERDGIFYPSKQLSTKTYRFSFLASEAVCDALRFARLSENIYITDSFGNRYRADSFLMTPEWQEQGDLASVVVEFTSESIVKKLGLGYFCEN